MDESKTQARELEGRVCVVTGGARGLGAAIARGLAAAGAAVAIFDLDEDGAAEVAAECGRLGAGAISVVVDVSDEASVSAGAERVAAELGPADVLVNNAGILSRIGPSFDLGLPEWEAAIGSMATGVFLCSRELGRQMKDRGGAIVNLSSINGLVAFPMRLAYSAAKAAVISMTEVLAVEWASYGIRVNAVAPGTTRTAMLEAAVREGAIDAEAYLGHSPMRRWGEPEEIADAVLFLASERASFVTGQTLAVDGGWTSFGWIPWSGDPQSPALPPRP